MKVTFVREFRHADDGINIVTYEPGEQDVSDLCAAAAIRTGAAKNSEAAEEPAEAKAKAGAPRNNAK